MGKEAVGCGLGAALGVVGEVVKYLDVSPPPLTTLQQMNEALKSLREAQLAAIREQAASPWYKVFAEKAEVRSPHPGKSVYGPTEIRVFTQPDMSAFRKLTHGS